MKSGARAILIGGVLTAILLVSTSRGVHIAEYGFQTSSFDLQQGRSIFSKRCAGCHNIGGNSAAVGPNLSQIGITAAQRKPGLTAASYLLESIMAPGVFKAPGSSGEMPNNLVSSYDEKAIRNLVAFLCATAGEIQEDDIAKLVITRPDKQANADAIAREQILHGMELYMHKAGCGNCHPFYGGSEFELMAPYLFHRGYRDKEALRRLILFPHANVAPQYTQTTVQLKNGKVQTGRLIHQDESQVIMLVNEHGVTQRKSIKTDDIERDENDAMMIEKSAATAMPSGIDQILTSSELDDLIAFLITTS